MANRPHPAAPSTVFSRSSLPEYQRILAILRTETVGGALLLAATVAALVWANSPLANGYFALRDVKIGYAPWHLELSLGHWASDGLLAVFFFIAGLELKREFVAGELRKPAKAIVPVAAAVGGVVLPALIYVVVNLGSGPETLRGWAIPTATDIAFALAVLAVINTHLPAALRTFLLTLAVVDDLIAIGIIAFFYSSGLEPFMLLAAAVPLALFTVSGPETRPELVPAPPPGRSHLGLRPCLGNPCHRRGCPARFRRAGRGLRQEGRACGRARRKLRTPLAPLLRRLCGACFRVLLRRRGLGRRRGPRSCPARSRGDRHRAGPCGGQGGRSLRHHIPHHQDHPRAAR